MWEMDVRIFKSKGFWDWGEDLAGKMFVMETPRPEFPSPILSPKRDPVARACNPALTRQSGSPLELSG